MRLYSRDELNLVRWPSGIAGDYARRVLTPFMRGGTAALIANVEAEVRVIVDGSLALPLVVVDGPSQSADPSYVVSPTSHYVDYGKREIEVELSQRPLLGKSLAALLECIRPLLRWGNVERAVYVNNWLLSTNLYPSETAERLEGLHSLLRRAFPGHALVFRSVNHTLNADLGSALRRFGYRAVFSRQVYLLDPASGRHRRKKSLRKDRRLARLTPYSWIDASQLADSDCARLKQLYDDLYLDKYSRYNPQFTEAFFRETLRSNWLTVLAIRAEGRIDGVLGFVERDGVMTTPLIGYDRSLPQTRGLYRLISLKLIDEAERRQLVLHQSSGASHFKIHRGSTASIEYSYVFDRHLSIRRRAPWKLLAGLSKHVALPLMRRLEL